MAGTIKEVIVLGVYYASARSIKLDPNDAAGYDNRALVYEARGEKALAENDRRKWRELQAKPK